jgi:hypothetical protein
MTGILSPEEEATIRVLEERLSTPEASDSRASLGELLAPEFKEFGSSGRVFDRDSVLDALVPGGRPRIVFEAFEAVSIARDVVLVTYLSRSFDGAGGKPPALRSSLWCRRQKRWQLVFHQGTRTAQDERS